jgi:predicted ATPase
VQVLRLKSFRIRNYKCVEDSGEVPVGDYTVLVGKNESGKTAVLKALHKFNSVKRQPYNGLREFPRKFFNDFQGDEPVVTLKFSLEDEEKEHIEGIDERFSNVTEVRVTKDYASNLVFEYLPADASILSISSLSSKLSDLADSIGSCDFSGLPNGEEIEESLRSAIENVGVGIDEGDDVSHSDVLNRQIQVIQDMANDELSRNTINPTLLIANEVLTKINSNPVIQVNEYLSQRFPTFIYFDSFAIIDSRIHLPSFIQKMKRGSLSPDERTTQTLFDMVNLDPELIDSLGRIEGKEQDQILEDLDERAIRVSRASVNLTGDLVKIWEQRENRVDFDADGEYIRLWVTDNIDGSKIELEERSIGFQWFLSFYIVFNVESEKGHKDSILLLDDPGIYLHATAQSGLLRVLQKLSERNQLIFTTHSPFMIDSDSLDSVRILTESKEGTKISAETLSTDKDAVFPLQAALGYSISQSLFFGKNNLVVEDITDYWLLSSLSNILRDSGRPCLHDSIVISPTGGAQKSSLLTAMLAGQKLKVGVLLNANSEGRKVRDDIIKNHLIRESNVIFVSEVAQEQNIEMEFEDLFPEDFYLEYVNRAYKKELRDEKLKTPLPSKKPRITQRIEDKFREMKLEFHKIRPTRLMLEDFGILEIEHLPEALIKKMEKLCRIINVRLVV